MFESSGLYNESFNVLVESRFDYFLPIFSLPFTLLKIPLAVLVGKALIFLIGCFFAFRLWGTSKLSALCLSCSLLIFTVLILGLGMDVLRWHYLPFLIASYCWCAKKPSVFSLIFACIVSYLWAISSTSLAFSGLIIAAFSAVYCLVEEERLPGRSDSNKNMLYLLVVCLVGVTLNFVFEPENINPDYPANARFQYVTHSVQLATILLSSSQIPDTANWIAIRGTAYSDMIWIVFSAATILAFLAVLRRFDGAAVTSMLLLFFAVSLVSFEALLPVEYLSLSPYQSIRRLVPFAAMEYQVGVLSTMLLIPALIFSASRWTSNLSFVLLLLCSAVLLSRTSYSPVNLGYEKIPIHKSIGLVLSGPDWLPEVENSPSAPVVEYFGKWITEDGVKERRKFKNMRRYKISDGYPMHASSNVNSKLAHLATDGSQATRWTTGREQRAGDYLEVVLEKRIPVTRVILSVLNAKQLFPRSFSVSSRNKLGKYETLVSYAPWNGPVEWSDKGYPYFGDLGHVIIDFPKTIETNSLKFELLDSANIAWSVEEVKLFAEKPSS